MVRIGKGGYLNVPYDILLPILCQTGWGIPYVLIYIYSEKQLKDIKILLTL